LFGVVLLQLNQRLELLKGRRDAVRRGVNDDVAVQFGDVANDAGDLLRGLGFCCISI
jgi:hypothetical protein